MARPAGEVAVLVLNGTEGPVAGIAGAGANKLKTNNYVTRDPKNATVPSPSAVYYADGFEAEAIAVASVFGADPAVVVQPLDPATVPISDTQSADIVVVVGNDGVIVV
ncbi:MAG: LytR C-terminal domain-containing protein [Acidimicrobiales bacterium]